MLLKLRLQHPSFLTNTEKLMSENVSIAGTTKILVDKDSVARVAFDMMKYFGLDGASKSEYSKSEAYLRLYRKCYLAASGQPISDVLKGE